MTPLDPGFKQLTPVIIVDAVEPCLVFWTERFGFAITATVPGPDGKITFAIVARNGIEVMYQTRASVLAEDPSAAKDLDGHSIAIFLTVASIDVVEQAVVGAPILKARHDTFYGSTEIYVLEPGGNTVGFAQMGTHAV